MDINMRKYKIKLMSLLAGFALLASASANERLELALEQVKTFAIAQELLNVTGEPVAVINTGVIKDDNGVSARGEHKVLFTLDPSSPYAVVVSGEMVMPGETKTIVKNLTESDHRLLLPIYPAVSGVHGVASYSLSIPTVNVLVCPADFAERESDCYKIEYSTIEYVCPAGTEYNKDTFDCRGIDEKPVVEYCELPFVEQNGVCVQEFTIAAGQSCPTDIGWYKEGTLCRYFATDVVESCPADYYLKNGNCYELTLKEQACPDGYTNDGKGSCHITKEADKTCPDGYTMDGAMCNYFDSEPISSCPNGYYFAGGMCHLIIDKSPVCPSDYTLVGEVCEKLESTPFSDACPDGYEVIVVEKNGAVTEECTGIEVEEILTGCPEGYTVNGGLCTTTKSSYDGCPAGYINQSGTSACDKIVEGDYRFELTAGYYCPEGYNLNGSSSYNRTCEKLLPMPESGSCPVGYTVNGGLCTTTKSAYNGCPAGYINQSGTSACNKIVEGNYRFEMTAGYYCPEGYNLSGSSSYNRTCEKLLPMPESGSCPEGYTVNGALCTTTKSAYNGCPAGYINQSGTSACDKIAEDDYKSPDSPDSPDTSDTSDSPDTSNSPDTSDSPDSPPTSDSVALGYYCPEGYDLSGNSSSDRTCEKLLPMPESGSCPVGYTVNGDECTTTQSAYNGCPAGYINQSGTSACDKIVEGDYSFELTAGYYCPEGYNLSGSSSYNRTCEKLIDYQRCPDGFVQLGDTCSITMTSDLIDACPAGYVGGEFSCNKVTLEDATLECSVESKELDGTQCYSNEPDLSQGICNAGYTFNSALFQCEDIRSEGVVYRCDSGWDLSGEMCGEVIDGGVNYFCLDGKTDFSASQCIDDEQSNDIGFCGVGFSLNTLNGECEEVRAQEVDWSCPEGPYSLNKPGCDYYEEEVYKTMCDSTNAILDIDNYVCKELIIDTADFVCEPDFTAVPIEDRCTKETTVPFL
jgi:conjugal transfer mating pair stabilization protein TraN